MAMRTRVAARTGTAVGALSRRLGAGGGTVIGGRVSLAIDRSALARLASGRRIALVSGTNGKTTTTRLLTAALSSAGPVVTNIGGANLPAGLVAALSLDRSGSPAALEVDEGFVGPAATAVEPVVVTLLNLSRDQLDRISEVRMLGAKWRAALAGLPSTHVVANADDPIVAWAAGAGGEANGPVTWVSAGQPWRADSSGCPRCEGRIHYLAAPHCSEGATDWSCHCGLSRPRPDLWLEGDVLAKADGQRLRIDLALPGRCNRANAAMATAAASAMGIPDQTALSAMAATAEIAGRYQVARTRLGWVRLLLAKNPAGWVETFDLIAPAPAPVVVAINAKVADGRDPSWLWDVPFERLAGRAVVASGERALDLGVRLAYAGVEHQVVPDVLAGVDAVLAGRSALPGGAGADESTPVDFVGNYTAFQDLRRQLARRRGGTDGAG